MLLSLLLLFLAAPAGDDAALQKRLDEIDARGAQIKDFSATFRQEKQTALLRKPLVSSGTVRVKEKQIRWDTTKPEPIVLHSDAKEFRLYYPAQKLLEIYPIEGRLSDLAASPLPRLKTLREHFSIRQISLETIGAKKDEPSRLALELTPTDESIAQHIAAVRVLLDEKAAHIVRVQTIDAEGDTTTIDFEDVKLNSGLKDDDLALKVPDDTKISRPLEGGNS